MKNLCKVVCLMASTGLIFAEDGGLSLPSSVPIEVFKMKENQRGFGYIQFNVNLEMVDPDNVGSPKIGTGQFDTHGIIYTEPRSKETFLGRMFESSYTLGVIKAGLKDNIFTDNGVNYNNTFDKEGFYVGIRPAFNTEFYSNGTFSIKNSTAIHAFLYNLKGDYSVNHLAYDEDSYGIGIKPSTVLQVTAYPFKNLALTAFGGVSSFLAVDYNSYSQIPSQLNQNPNDEDTETNFATTGINPLYGYDVTYNVFGKYPLSLSMAVEKQDTDNSIETILRYTHNF